MFKSSRLVRNLFTTSRSVRVQTIRYQSNPMKVTICGAAGRTGQPLSLLLKQSQLLDEIALYDIKPTCSACIELGHVDTKCKVRSYGPCRICEALKDAKVVVLVACGCYNCFECNAPIITNLVVKIATICPQAFVVVATEPVETLVPLVAEIQRVRGSYVPRRLLGVTELNCMRANTVVADFLGVPPENININVVGGTSPNTIVPLLYERLPRNISQPQQECLSQMILRASAMEARRARCWGEMPNLAGAYAIAKTTLKVIKGLLGKQQRQCAFVDCPVAPHCQFLSSEVVLGPVGIEQSLGLADMTRFENCLFFNALPIVRQQIMRAEWFVYSVCCSACTQFVYGPCAYPPPGNPTCPPLPQAARPRSCCGFPCTTCTGCSGFPCTGCCIPCCNSSCGEPPCDPPPPPEPCKCHVLPPGCCCCCFSPFRCSYVDACGQIRQCFCDVYNCYPRREVLQWKPKSPDYDSVDCANYDKMPVKGPQCGCVVRLPPSVLHAIEPLKKIFHGKCPE